MTTWDHFVLDCSISAIPRACSIDHLFKGLYAATEKMNVLLEAKTFYIARERLFFPMAAKIIQVIIIFVSDRIPPGGLT